MKSRGGQRPNEQPATVAVAPQASRQDILLYISDMLGELETLASQVGASSIKDLLGVVQRETDRLGRAS